MPTIQQGSDQAPAMISASEWQAFRAILQQKYEHENMTLRAVRDYMREVHEFSASPSQYQRAFNKWGFRKNAKRRDAEEVIVSAKRRKLSLSQVTLEGASSQEQERFKRVLRRYNTPGLPYSRWNLASSSHERHLNNARLLSRNSGIVCFRKDKAVGLVPKLYTVPSIFSLPTFSLMSHLGWRLPESPSLLYPNKAMSLLTAKGTSFNLLRHDTRATPLYLDSIVYAYRVLNRTLNDTTEEELFSFIDKGSMDSLLRYMCRSESYIARTFIRNLLSLCFDRHMLAVRFRTQFEPVLRKLVRLGTVGDTTLPTPWPTHVGADRKTTSTTTLLQVAIASQLFDFATSLLEKGADVNLCGTHGPFTDHHQPRCCEMLPIVLLLEHTVEAISDDTGSAKLLTMMQTNGLICCKALCLSSVATHHCLSWFLSKSNVDLNAPNLAQVYNYQYLRWLSPLQVAIDESNYETVLMLLEAGADPSGFCFDYFGRLHSRGCGQVPNKLGFDAVAGQFGSKQLLRFFEGYLAMPPLSVASFRGDLAIIRLLLSRGAPINGCQLDLHQQEVCHPLDRQGPIYQPFQNHSCCATSYQRYLLTYVIHRSGIETLGDFEKDAFTELQPWKGLSKTADKCQLVDYSIYFGHSALQLAVVTSQQGLVNELLRCGADVEGCHGLTPLALAICTGNAILVDTLLGYGADPRGSCRYGPRISPFSVAAYLNDVATMKKLMATGRISCFELTLQHECCPWEAAMRGTSYHAVSYLLRLHYNGGLVWSTGNSERVIKTAILRSEWSLAQFFLNEYAQMLNMDQISNLLYLSIEGGDLAVTARLLALGGSLDDEQILYAILKLDLQDAQHRRSFIAFAFETMSARALAAIIDMLAELDLDLDFLTIKDETLRDVVRYLKKHHAFTAADSSKLLTNLLILSHEDAALYLLEDGAYMDYYEKGQELTGLQHAAQTNNSKLVSRLVQLGADVNADPAKVYPEDGSMTALQFAVDYGNINIVEQLLGCGAYINALGDRAVMQIITTHEPIDMDMINLLLEHGADVNAVGRDDRYPTALQNAAGHNEIDIVNMLLAKGADVNAQARGRFGRTALQASVERQYHELSNLLLDKGADVNAPPARERGVTALQAAAIVGDLEMCHTLLAAGANADADGSEIEGRTAIEGAAEHGRLDVLSWLLNVLVDQYRGQNAERLKASIERAKPFARDNENDYIVQFLEKFEETLDEKLPPIVS